MSIQTKIIFDQLFGLFFLKPIIYFIKLRTFFFPATQKQITVPKTILVCKFKGMGSIIQSTPFLKFLRNKFPDSRLIFLTSSANKSLLDQIKIIDEFLVLNDSNIGSLLKGFYVLVIKLKKLQIDYYFDLEVYSFFSAFLTWISGAKIKSGFYTRKSMSRKWLFHDAVMFKSEIPLATLHHNLYTHENLNYVIHSKNNFLYSFRSEAVELDNLFRKFGITAEKSNIHEPEYIVINPNASDLRIERRWPAENFIELIEKICLLMPELKIILTGNRQEADYTSGIVGKITPFFKNNVVSVAGKITLAEFSSLLEHSLLFITNDTGPMHLAFSHNVKTLALFGPCNPDFYEIPSQAKIFYKGVSCSPCVHTTLFPPCKGNNVCMKNISVEEVFKEAGELLTKARLQLTTAIF